MKLKLSTMAMVIGAVCAPSAMASLHGADLEAAQAYFAAHPDLPYDKQGQILDAQSLTQANDELTNYAYWDASKNKNIYPGLIPAITPIATSEPTKSVEPVASIATIEPVEPQIAALTTEQGERLVQENTERTAQQKRALQASLSQHFQQLKGDALVQANAQRTASQTDALKGALLTQSNIERTSAQNTALNAAHLEKFQQLKGESLIKANADRASQQKAALQSSLRNRFHQLQAERGTALTQANIERTTSEKSALNASRLARFNELKNQSLIDSNVSRTSAQVAALKTAKGDSLVQANLSRTAPQAMALEAAKTNAALTNANIQRVATQNVALHDSEQGHALTLMNQQRTAPHAAALHDIKQGEALTEANVSRNAAQVTALESSKQVEQGHALTLANQQRTTSQHVDNATVQVMTLADTIEGAEKQEAIRNSDRVQGMLHAKQEAETKAAVNAIPAPAKDIASNRSAIDANKQTIKATQGDVKKLAKQQQVQSVYYGEQIQTLAANQGEVITAVNDNHAANRATQSQADRNTQQINKLNSNFSNLKSEVNDNKKQASAGVSGAMAQANIPQVIQGQTFAVGAGVGGYDGESAVAVGFSARVTQGVTVKATVSDDTASNVGYGAGVSFGW